MAGFTAYRAFDREEALFWVLGHLGKFAKFEQSPQAVKLMADIQGYRAASADMDPKKAADEWLALHDRVRELGSERGFVWDPGTTSPLGIESVFAALPGPRAWPAMREAANARVQKSPEDSGALGLRYVTEQLTGDRKAAAATLDAIERLPKSAGRDPEALSAQVAYVRSEAARLYGSREEIAASFVASLDARGKDAYDDVEVPDLVGLVGEAKARAILREALTKPVRLRVPEGEQTRALAWRIALEQVGSLPVPQWGLVDSMEAAPLYEALERRFSGPDAKKVENKMERYGGYDRRKSDADTYYFLHLVVKGRHADAEKALRNLVGGNELHLPKREIDALRRAGYHEALYKFLHDLLGRRPEMRAWEVYTREAAFTGHSAQALALVEELLKRKDLAESVRADLRFRRANALLAADKIEPAVAELRELLAAPPKKDEKTLQARTEAAVRLAGLGRILEQRELSGTGLAFARAVLALPADRDRAWRRAELLREVLAEQRKLGLVDEAQALVKAELERKPPPDSAARFGMGMPTAARAATIEAASLHAEAKRHQEVVALLDDSPDWGARDLGALLSEKDSLGVPFALTAARALAQTGKPDRALVVLRALIDTLPGSDPAYELVVGLDKDAHAYLDKVYAGDQFEERPLIWKAILFVRSGRYLEAESLIRRAIVIDPSDGEEGPNDRMRAYAVLADVLEAKGAKEPAAGFRKAVNAIRISERSDELRRLGLYERAFAGYRAALEQFADAYCIQSRLAIRLMEQGRREEAFEHYRRAYELMPASFGRVESHCFGCESVFQGDEQQTLAEKVFGQMLAKDPKKPQLHYLLGYLQKERGRYPESLKRFSESVRLDSEYLNAWKHLHDLGTRIYVEPRERDIARLKLVELDPRQRHVHYELDSVGDLGALWRATDAAYAANKPVVDRKSLYPLRRSAATLDEAQAKLPEIARSPMRQFEDGHDYASGRSVPAPYLALGKHRLLQASAGLIDPR